MKVWVKTSKLTIGKIYFDNLLILKLTYSNHSDRIINVTYKNLTSGITFTYGAFSTHKWEYNYFKFGR